MVALYRSGRQAEALGAYADARRILVEQLGIEPGRALRDLERAVLRHDAALELAPTLRAEPTAEASAEAQATDDLGPFVGRALELERLRAALADALSGRGRLVMLAGEPGIGKTRIARELVREAAGRGARVLWGRCYEREGAPPYWPWLQAIRSYVDGCDPVELRAQLGAGAMAVGEVVPEVARCLGDIEPAAPLPDEKQARFRLLDSLASFLKRAAAARPIVLVLEDLDAADAGSLGLLEFVAQDLGDARLLVVGAYRDVDLARGHPLARTLAELRREHLVERLSLRGLSEPDVATYVEAAVGGAPPELVAMVHRRTEGNPLFVREFVELLAREGRLTPETLREQRDWSVGVPEGLREVIGLRLDRLSQRSNDVLRLASVIGREFRHEQLAKVGDWSENELLVAVEEALAARVVEELPASPGAYRFTHALFQDTLAVELSTTRRIRLHARIASALEELYGDRAAAHAAELAYHFAEAETVLGPERLIHYSRLAGEQAFAAHAYEDAIAHFQRALDAREGSLMDDETAALLVALVRSEFLGRQRYDLSEALERMRQAFDYYAAAGDTPRAVEVAAYPIPPVWGPTDVPALLARALELGPPDSLDAGCILANAGRFLGTNEGDYEAATGALERALAIAQLHGDAALERRLWPWQLEWTGGISVGTRALPEAGERSSSRRPPTISKQSCTRGHGSRATRPCTAGRRRPEPNRPSRSVWRTDCVSGTGRRRHASTRSGSPCSKASGPRRGFRAMPACGHNRATRATLAFGRCSSISSAITKAATRFSDSCSTPWLPRRPGRRSSMRPWRPSSRSLPTSRGKATDVSPWPSAPPTSRCPRPRRFPSSTSTLRGPRSNGCREARRGMRRGAVPGAREQRGTRLSRTASPPIGCWGSRPHDAGGGHRVHPLRGGARILRTGRLPAGVARAAIDYAYALGERAGPWDAPRAAALGGEGMEIAGELGLGTSSVAVSPLPTVLCRTRDSACSELGSE